MSSQSIKFDSTDASPFVRVIASLLDIALRDDGLRTKAAKAKGTLVLRSPKGNPSTTIVFSPTSISLENGNTGGADIIVTTDFDQPSARPAIDGLMAHPLFGYLVLPLLDVSLPDWQQSAATFWQLSHGQPSMPTKLTITCTTDHQSLSWGETSDEAQTAEIFANRATLERLLLGHAVLVSEAIAGQVKFRGTVEQMAGISQCGQKLLLGELSTELGAN